MADAHPARSGPGCDGCLRALLREHSELPATVPAAPPASPSQSRLHGGCAPHPEQLELEIAESSADVLRLQALADATEHIRTRGAIRSEARRAAARVARLSAMRAPEVVRAMEVARGLV